MLYLTTTIFLFYTNSGVRKRHYINSAIIFYHFLVVNLDGNNEIWKCHSMRDYGVTDIHLKKEKLTNMNQYADLSKKRNIE